jgi:hypothetical protein
MNLALAVPAGVPDTTKKKEEKEEMTDKPRTCPDCDYYSVGHHSCFHPATWSPGEFFKVPGDPLVWNPGGHCKMWEPIETVQPIGKFQMLWFRVQKFFSKNRRSK